MKATFEQAFKTGAPSSSAPGGAAAPWALSYQMSERYSMLWNDDLKARLLQVGGAAAAWLEHTATTVFPAS